jgi:type IX secretion system substrate protein
MKKNLLIAITLLFISPSAFSQAETSNWYFGVFAGLHFTTSGPAVIASPNIYTNEGCSSISDATGNLLFYTDGVSVWNKNHLIMPNGSGLLGGSSSTQAALIVPQPGSTTLYYIFTTAEFGGTNGCRYSVVDMSLQTGTGDVTSVKNVPVLANSTEKLTAVKHGNSIDYWIAIHEWGTDAFYVYSLTAAGFQSTPVISNTGIVHSTAVNQNTYGQMKFSFCGDMLAAAVGYLDTVEIFNFDNTTGIVSNPITLPLFAHVYGLEFSGDQHLLYVSTYDPSATLVQFDLTAGSTAAIIASKAIISFTPDIYGMQMAMDGKIYVCRSFSSFLGVINDPAIPGTGCNYMDNGFDLDPNFMGTTSALGLPGFVQSNFRSEIACSPSQVNEMNGHASMNIYPNPFSNNFNIQFSEINHPSEIIIYDGIGKKIDEISVPSDQTHLSLGKTWASGIYFLFIKNNSANSEVIKIVKTGN